MPPSDTESLSDGASGAEPMDVAMPCSSSDINDVVATSPSSISMPTEDNCCSNGLLTLEKQNSSDSLMQIEGAEMMVDKKCDAMTDKVSYLTEEDAILLVDLFYMPFEHGAQGLFLLQRLHWLRNNCQCIVKSGGKRNSFEVNAT